MRQQFTPSDMDEILHHARRVKGRVHGFGAVICLKNQAQDAHRILARQPPKEDAAHALVHLLFAYALFCDKDGESLSAADFPTWELRDATRQEKDFSAEMLCGWASKLAYMTAEGLQIPENLHAHVRESFSQVAADFGLSVLDIRIAAANLRVVAA